MTKKILVALAFMATALLATNSFGVACSGGAQIQFLGAGSSAQFNSFAYAAYVGLGLNATNSGGFWTTGSATLADSRFTPAVTDSGVTFFVAWDSNTICNVYGYYNIDSAVGVKDFFATAKSVLPGKGVYSAVFPPTGATWQNGTGANKVPGLTDNPTTLPAMLASLLVASPAPTTATQIPQPGCGQEGLLGTNTIYCYITAGMTDIRPEDALYATTRALSSYNTTNGLTGLGYNQTACGASGTNQGCQILDAFGQGKIFNVLRFALTGTDPQSKAAVPVYTTLSTGAAPLLVLVHNYTGSSASLGSKTGSNYNFTNINRAVLSNVFQGTTSCTGDLENSQLDGFTGVGTAFSGEPLNVIRREPLSGTYNAWEFTAVRTLSGSQALTVSQHSITTSTWLSDDDSSQELDPYLNLGTQGPAANFGTGNCSGTGAGVAGGANPCGDPLYNPLWDVASSHQACGQPWKAGVIGTGEEVKATINGYSATANLIVNNGIGYSFWSYQNFAPTATGCETGVSGVDVTCSGYLGHYLTVDGIDPLYPSAASPVDASGTAIPGGAYNAPQCAAVQSLAHNGFPCQQLPFTHIYDGTYPLWSQLRFATFANVSGKQVTPQGAINMLAAAEREAVDSNFLLSDFVPLLKNVSTTTYLQGLGSVNVSGTGVTFVKGDPFDSNWCGSTTFPVTCSGGSAAININGVAKTIATINTATSITLTATATTATGVPYTWDAGALPTGDLNLQVFRSHYIQDATIQPQNGHSPCNGVFTGISIVGGKGPTATGTCLVDVGGDMGGSVLTVQSDVDFGIDFGTVNAPYPKPPKEIYGQRQ